MVVELSIHSISTEKPFALDRHRDTSDFCRMLDKKNELVHRQVLTTFSPFSLHLSLSLSLSLVARHFFCVHNWLSSSYTRIQFIFSSARHTQLNGNMPAIVERRKELVHTHTFSFLCV